MSADTPLAGSPPAEIPLRDPPLVRVIAQVRFPLIASVEQRAFIAPFQEALRQGYPVLRQEEERGFVLGPTGAWEARNGIVWRLHDATGAWRVSLGSEFLALETMKYSSRADFLRRFAVVVQALKDHINPQVIDRIGVRYIDRVVGDDFAALRKLVRPEVAGILATPLAAHVRHAISENVFDLPDGGGAVMARWGHVPAAGTVDPGTMEPIDQPSWILDVDAFQTETRALDVALMVDQARGFAERIYSIFRWVVTDEFLRRYGGEP